MSCLISITLFTILVTLSSAGGCTEKKTFGAGHIIDIMLDSKESQALTLKINNGVYDYCRSLNLQNGEISFDEISCKNNIRSWAKYQEYDIDIEIGNWGTAEAFQLLDDNDQFNTLENIIDTELTVYFEGLNHTLLLDDIFVHPFYFSYFYSPSMKTIFILTADQNETTSSPTLSFAFSKINLITISYNPTGSQNVLYPMDVNDFLVGQQMDITQNNLVGDAAAASFILNLGGKNNSQRHWPTFDTYDEEEFMFMVRTNSFQDDCNDPEWLRYSYIPHIYDARDKGNDEGANGTFYFDYAGQGYKGVDTRIKRAYEFTGHKVWYYEVDDERFDAFRIKYFEFEHSELSSYWALMWFLICLFLLCCCCCTIYCIKKKKDNQKRTEDRFGMTEEQEMMTVGI